MAGAFAYTPAIWPPLVTAGFVTAVALYAWQRRDLPGGKPFVALSLISGLCLLLIAFQAAATTSATKIVCYKLLFVGLLSGTTAATCIILDYAYPGRWLSRRNLTLLSIPPFLALLLVVIGNSQIMWRRLEVGPDGTVMGRFGGPGAVLLAYGVGLVLLNTAVSAGSSFAPHSTAGRWR